MVLVKNKAYWKLFLLLRCSSNVKTRVKHKKSSTQNLNPQLSTFLHFLYRCAVWLEILSPPQSHWYPTGVSASPASGSFFFPAVGMENCFLYCPASLLQVGTSHLGSDFSCCSALIHSATCMPKTIFCTIKVPSRMRTSSRKIQSRISHRNPCEWGICCCSACKQPSLWPLSHPLRTTGWSNSQEPACTSLIPP